MSPMNELINGFPNLSKFPVPPSEASRSTADRGHGRAAWAGLSPGLWPQRVLSPLLKQHPCLSPATMGDLGTDSCSCSWCSQVPAEVGLGMWGCPQGKAESHLLLGTWEHLKPCPADPGGGSQGNSLILTGQQEVDGSRIPQPWGAKAGRP